jgi:hypothetical protein
MTAILDDAQAIVDRLNADLPDGSPAPFRAYLDPAEAASNRPCFLVPPPAIDLTTRRATWRLVALSSEVRGTFAALAELVPLVERAEDVLPIEAADPANYLLTDQLTAPAYLVRLTTTTEE